MGKNKILRFNIETQGAPQVSNEYGEGVILYKYDDVVIAEIDMQSKWCEVSSTLTGDKFLGVFVNATKRSLHLLEGKDMEEETLINFPNFLGWRIYSAECCRYTLRLVFIKEKENGA
jgi:hypothetical protein